MTGYSIGEVAKLTNVSVRTLHHYDTIGLLKPSTRADSGYRYYAEADLSRLHSVLFFRALGLSLKEIASLLEAGLQTRRSLLHTQKQRLDEHIERLHTMRDQLEKTLLNEERKMNKTNDFSALDGFDPDQYEDEAYVKWGQTDAYKESARRTKKYTKADWAQYKEQHEALNNELIQVMEQGLAPTSSAAVAIAEKMRLQIDQWFYPCSHEMHIQLGEMYVQDPRFTENYDKQRKGMAEYLRKAIKANSII